MMAEVQTDVAGILQAEGRTELANARRFVAQNAGRVRYVAAWSKWIVWTGQRWLLDDGCAVHSLAKGVAESLWTEIGELLPELGAGPARELVAFARATASAKGVEHLLTLARSEPGIPVGVDELDHDAWLLNLQNGTVDLRTGAIHAHNRADLITKIAPVAFNPDADCPQWYGFLGDILPDAELRDFMRRLAGYWLTGSVRDHLLPVLCGTGANGKSVLLTTLLALLGPDYSCKSPAAMLLASASDQHPTGLADLYGKRLVACIEADAGRRLNEALVKELTGGDAIRARRMREDFWQFQPTHKLVLATNHRPTVRGTDNGIWRRLKLVPFNVTIPDDAQDRQLPEKLQAELPGILNWAMSGCIEWQANGLGKADAITAATESYKAESDVLADWLAACCTRDPDAKTASGDLYKSYAAWANANGENVMSSTMFGKLLTERDFEPCSGPKKLRMRRGLYLTPEL
jgi:putative DNA primase/helicase